MTGGPTGLVGSTQQNCRELGLDLFERLRGSSADGAGVTRGSYSAAEDVAHRFLANRAVELGLTVWADEAANTWVELVGSDPGAPAVVVGSHLDSVRQGGNYDGSAGVFAGLIVLGRLAEGPPLARSVRLVAFRGEESAWFGTCYVGSRALVGGLTASMLDAAAPDNRSTLREAMIEAGADLDPIDAGRPLVPLESIHRYFELHIEQGPVLVDARCSVGAVTGIRGNHRYASILWKGVAGHSGAVPRSLRRDAVLGAAEWIGRVEQLWVEEEAAGADLVVTSGIVSTNPLNHAITRIPDHVRVSLDIRSVDEETLERVSHLVEELGTEVAAKRGLQVSFGDRVVTAPGLIPETVSAAVVEAATDLGYPIVAMPSGAGHDAAALSEAGIEAGMIFVRNENGSHNPDEAMDIGDFCVGVDVLTLVVRRTAQ